MYNNCETEAPLIFNIPFIEKKKVFCIRWGENWDQVPKKIICSKSVQNKEIMKTNLVGLIIVHYCQ